MLVLFFLKDKFMKKVKFEKFKVSAFKSLNSIKGGFYSGGKTATTRNNSNDQMNDKDSNAGLDDIR